MSDQDDAALRARIAQLRRAIIEGAVIDMGDGTARKLEGATLLLCAHMVHRYDVLRWEAAGKTGRRPSLSGLLRRADTGLSRPPSLTEWMAYATDDQWAEELRQEFFVEEQSAYDPKALPVEETRIVFKPRDVATIRHQAIGWLDRQGEEYYLAALLDGRQPVYVDLSLPDNVHAARLAQAERAAMAQAQLYFFDRDMCILLQHAYPTMPDFAPVPSDLPSEYGFAIFALPLSSHDSSPEAEDTAFHTGVLLHSGEVVDMDHRQTQQRVQIMGVSWRPHTPPDRTAIWTKGGVWMTLYAPHPSHDLATHGRMGMSSEERVMWQAISRSTPQLIPDNESALSWYDRDTWPDREAAFLLKNGQGTSSAARAVLAAFQLARQQNLAQVTTETTMMPPKPVPAGKKKPKQKPKPRRVDVRVVRLRGSIPQQRADTSADAGTPSRQYQHRWLVRGFWRNTWYPSTGAHRPQWIEPYLKGPDGAPFKSKPEVVNLISPPNNQSTKS